LGVKAGITLDDVSILDVQIPVPGARWLLNNSGRRIGGNVREHGSRGAAYKGRHRTDCSKASGRFEFHKV
jgi:hypothetical protein